jgi:hypothetical protein
VKTGAVVYFFIFAVYASLTGCLGSRAGAVSSVLATLENASTGSSDAHRRSESVRRRQIIYFSQLAMKADCIKNRKGETDTPSTFV